MPKTKFPTDKRMVRRRSGIHGSGVFARELIPAGTRLAEYVGERITQAEGDLRYTGDDSAQGHTMLFTVDDDVVIDGGVGGNVSRWINHSCDPNCTSVIEDGRVFVDTLRDIQPGEELTYDYHLIVNERHTPAVKRRHPCHCGAPKCRGTMLKPKR